MWAPVRSRKPRSPEIKATSGAGISFIFLRHVIQAFAEVAAVEFNPARTGVAGPNHDPTRIDGGGQNRRLPPT